MIYEFTKQDVDNATHGVLDILLAEGTLTKEEQNGVAIIAKTPIIDIRKELQVIQKNRNLDMK